MQSQPSPALPTSVDIQAIDGQRADAVLNNIDLEKGGQQGQLWAAVCSDENNLTSLGPAINDTDPSEPNSKFSSWIRRATLPFTSTRQSESPPPALTQSPWQQEERVSRIDGHPEGYPQLAAFINSDESFLMCRSFGWLNSRVLLYRQAELVEYEERLLDMDEDDITYREGITLKSKKEDDDRVGIEEQYTRKTLINQIDSKLKEYRKFSLLVLSPALNVKENSVED